MFLKKKNTNNIIQTKPKQFDLRLINTTIVVFALLLGCIGHVNAQTNNKTNNKGSALLGSTIEQLLSNQSISGKRQGKLWKHFYLPHGQIHYSDNEGKATTGYWRIENDLYCELWPPKTQWQCYILSLQGNRLIFKAVYSDRKFSANISK